VSARQRTTLLTLLITLTLINAQPSSASPNPATHIHRAQQRTTDAPTHALITPLEHPPPNLATAPISPPASPTPRTRLIRRIATPNIAVLLLGVGTLLIFAECNLPGAILPGASGLLLFLSGIYGLTFLPLRPQALLFLLAAAIALALSAKTPAFGLPALLGTASLVYSLLTLIANSSTTSSVHPAIAITLGAAIGVSASLLGRVAAQARRNKTVLSSTTHLSSPNSTGPDAPEHPLL